MDRTSRLLLGLDALPASLLLCSGAIIMVNKGFCEDKHYNNAATNSNSENTRSERWQVCGEAWVWGQRKNSPVLGAFGLLDFTMLRSVLTWRAF
jgi:hypothetical protein